MSSIDIECLRPCRAFRGMNDRQVRSIAAKLTWLDLESEEPLTSPGEPMLALHTVARGRLLLYRFEGNRDRFIGYANMGETIGQASLLSTEIEKLSKVVAEIPSRVAVLDRDAALRFIGEIPRFRENLFATFGRRLRRVVAGEQIRRIPKVVGVVSSDGQSRKFLPLIARRLQRSGENVHVLTDRTDKSLVGQKATSISVGRDLRRRIGARLAENNRVLIDLTHLSRDAIQRTVDECGELLWCCNNRYPDLANEALLGEMAATNSEWASRIVCVQLTSAGPGVGRRQPCCPDLLQRDFVFPIEGPAAELRRLQPPAIDRIFRHLRGFKIGLALGGGGARGLAHLGVLKVFDRAGISFDIMSGTSAGAMIGLGYAAGVSPEFLIDAFTKTLAPPELYEKIPGGRRLFLFTKFLQQAWEEMLREYYGDWTFQQLPIPFSVVATDLVAGAEVVRDAGDIVEAILESINVPLMSEPILKDGKVLVDGGVLNNLPSELLTDQGAEFVIGVDASKEIPNHFAGNFSHMKTHDMKSPGRLETAYRVMEVSRRGIAQLQMSMADVVIEPDTSAFDFADFTSAAQIAKTGEIAAEKALPEVIRSYEHLMND